MRSGSRAGWVVYACLLAALLLAIVPLPDWLDFVRPSFPLLVLIFWSMSLPERHGTWTGWFLGLVFDVLRGTPLGAHALAFAVAGFAASRLGARMKVYPMAQQALAVGVLSGLSLMVLRIVGNLTGTTTAGLFTALLPVVATAVVWPWAHAVQDRLRRRYNVN
ncbi:MAG: rod shape-determining protein MreD [Gammaproteobacteria bacterium]